MQRLKAGLGELAARDEQGLEKAVTGLSVAPAAILHPVLLYRQVRTVGSEPDSEYKIAISSVTE